MSLLLEFTVPGQPVPKARARVVNGHSYTPERTKAAEERVAAHFKAAYPHIRPTGRPVTIRLAFFLKGVQVMDWDNLSKLVCDALNGKAWVDDRQIRGAMVNVVPESGLPRTEIEIWDDSLVLS